MKKPDHDTLREWLHLEVLGSAADLAPEPAARLADHLALCPECQAERRDLEHLSRALSRGTLAVRPDFRQGVMAALPAAGWEARHPRTWRFPAAVAVVLLAAATTLFGRHAPGAATGSPVAGALFAIAGFFRATLAAGLGLVHANWKGWGMVFREVFASWTAISALGVLVICLNLLLLSLMRRRRPTHAHEMGTLRR